MKGLRPEVGDLVLLHHACGRDSSLFPNIHSPLFHGNDILSFELGTWLPDINTSLCLPCTKMWPWDEDMSSNIAKGLFGNFQKP